MKSQLSFLTQSILDQATSGKLSDEVRRALDELAAIMLYPRDLEARAQFMKDAEIRVVLERTETRKLTAKDAVAFRDLLVEQRNLPVSVSELEERNKRNFRNAYAHGLVFCETLKRGNADAASRQVAADLPSSFDRNFRRNLHFKEIAHLWASWRRFRDSGWLPCAPQDLSKFLAVARGYYDAVEADKASGDFAIPAGLVLDGTFELRDMAGKRPKNARMHPRELVDLSGELRT